MQREAQGPHSELELPKPRVSSPLQWFPKSAKLKYAVCRICTVLMTAAQSRLILLISFLRRRNHRVSLSFFLDIVYLLDDSGHT